MYRKTFAFLAAAALVAACGRGKDQNAVADSLSRDLQMAPATGDQALKDVPAAPKPAAPKPAAPKPAAPKPVAALTLATGTEIASASNHALNSWHDKPGKPITATVGSDIRGSDGRVVIPAGSIIHLTVMELKPAENTSQKDGIIVLRVDHVRINGRAYPLSADVTSVQHTLKGRGVQAGDVAKVGAGAAVGAIAGKIIGGNTKGAVIGGAVGAGAGAAVASQTYDRDVIVVPGAAIIITLRQPLTL